MNQITDTINRQHLFDRDSIVSAALDYLNDSCDTGYSIGLNASGMGCEISQSTFPSDFHDFLRDGPALTSDPVNTWIMANIGGKRWNEITTPDLSGFFEMCRDHEIRHGYVYSLQYLGRKCILNITRSSQPFSDEECIYYQKILDRVARRIFVPEGFSEKEKQVLRGFGAGKNAQQIANELLISRKAVQNRLLGIRKKMGANTLNQALIMINPEQIH